ncbi:hypothetical protein QC762_112770 [Podospora pseudocomata]|uniref:Uncharacterized protein n=1 Tax=Podospora pseudocomata TaxID=2093779 RepID=A0ABR0GVD7_9PEZI|nr:hypothetical protein QC762_112770 [Podospora pseudocomata]
MAPPSGATLSSRTATTSKVTPVPLPKPGSMSSRAPMEKSAPAVPTAPTTTASFGVLATSDSNVPDASSGPHRDGRIRNPVPSKLKGKTDGSKGNFSVMHIDVAGRTEATERDAEAKRTSESTELAAKRAYENGYVSLRRSRFIHIPDEPEPAAKPIVLPQAPVTAAAHRTRQTPLTPEETKAEQARLLTLLRSLHPVLVVDQICKALAFFGGIPGGPPPGDGFPQSAESNGSGSLFVGWIAEIFPRLGGNTAGQQPVIPAIRDSDPPPLVSTRRKRGRPKGSKGTRPRIDKGIKKGPLMKAVSGTAESQQHTNAADESWVDVEDDAVDEVDANVMLLAQSSTPQPVPQLQQSGVAHERPLLATSTPVRTTLPTAPTTSSSTIDLTPSARKRGRPKGSKNRPKDGSSDIPARAQTGDPLYSQRPDAVGTAARASSPRPQASQPAQASSTPRVFEHSTSSRPFTPVNAGIPSTATKKVGRSKALEDKQRPTSQRSHIPPGITTDHGARAATLSASGAASGVTTRVEPETAPGGALPGAAMDTVTGTTQKNLAQTGNASTSGPRTESTNKEPATLSQGLDNTLGSFATTDFVYSAPPDGLSSTSSHRSRPRPSQTSRQTENPQGQTLALPTPPSASPALPNTAPGSLGQKRKRTAKTGGSNHVVQSGASNQASPQMNGPALPTPPANVGSAHSTATSVLQPPVAKRPRRGKGPKETTAVANQDPAAANIELSTTGAMVGLRSDSGPHSALSSSAAAALSLTTMTESRDMASDTNETSVPSVHSPHQNHYEVQSPTMENYEAQLQAQIEQQAEMESQTVSHQTRVDPPQYRSARQPRQQQQQQQSTSASTPQRRSPNTQPQVSNPQAGLSLATQLQTRMTGQGQYPQYLPPNSQYNQSQHSKQSQSSSQSLSSSQHQQHHQQQQQQQQQQQSSHFLGQQKLQGQIVQGSPAQQYSVNSTQQQQRPSNQSSYTNKQQQQQQQQLSSQQRYQQQHLTTTVGSTNSYNTQPPSQFAGSATNNYTATTDGTYRASSTSLGTSTYVQRSQSTTPSTAASFRSSGTHGLPHHSPSFNTGSGAAQQRAGSASHATNQGVQGMSGSMQAFSGNTGGSWELFDTGHIDASGQPSSLGLTNTYGINTTNARTSGNSSTFGAAGLGTYDTSGLPYNERYHGVGRR